MRPPGREFYLRGPLMRIICRRAGALVRRPRRTGGQTMRYRTFAAASIAALLGLAAIAADAVTLRWAGRGDMQTTDPHSQNEGLTNNINALIYEFLVNRDKKLGLVPGLAESWTQVNPTTWRFKLRAGV